MIPGNTSYTLEAELRFLCTERSTTWVNPCTEVPVREHYELVMDLCWDETGKSVRSFCRRLFTLPAKEGGYSHSELEDLVLGKLKAKSVVLINPYMNAFQEDINYNLIIEN